MERFLLSVLLISRVYASHVIELNDENFHATVNVEKTFFVEFYAPWCGHCQGLEPIWAEAAGILHEEGVKLGKYDATAEPREVADAQKVAGYPALFMYHDGIGRKYRGPKETVEDIVSYARRHNKPASPILKTQAEIDAVLNDKSQTAVIGYLAKSGGHDERVFQACASWMRDQFTFYKVTNPKLCRKNWQGSDGAKKTARKDSALAVIRPYSTKPVVWYQEQMHRAPDVDLFIWKATVAEVNFLTPHVREVLETPELPLLVSFIEEETELEAAFDTLRGTGLKYENKLVVTAAKVSEYAYELQRVFDYEVKPGSMVVMMEKSLWVYGGEGLTAETVSDFAQKFFAGEVRQQIKSSPVPETPYHEGHTELVGTTFPAALNENKNLFVFMYAPWCGHSKASMPLWKRLAQKLENVREIMVASVDATENSLPMGWTTQGYPTIRLLREGHSETITFDEDRDMESLMAFLRAQIPGVAWPDASDDNLTSETGAEKEEL